MVKWKTETRGRGLRGEGLGGRLWDDGCVRKILGLGGMGLSEGD